VSVGLVGSLGAFGFVTFTGSLTCTGFGRLSWLAKISWWRLSFLADFLTMGVLAAHGPLSWHGVGGFFWPTLSVWGWCVAMVRFKSVGAVSFSGSLALCERVDSAGTLTSFGAADIEGSASFLLVWVVIMGSLNGFVLVNEAGTLLSSGCGNHAWLALL
jgi:hypothetical protein